MNPTIPAHRVAGTPPQVSIANYGTDDVDPNALLSPAERGARAAEDAAKAEAIAKAEEAKAEKPKPPKSEI